MKSGGGAMFAERIRWSLTPNLLAQRRQALREAGVPAHRLKDKDIVDHLVEMVEKKAREIEDAKKVAELANVQSAAAS